MRRQSGARRRRSPDLSSSFRRRRRLRRRRRRRRLRRLLLRPVALLPLLLPLGNHQRHLRLDQRAGPSEDEPAGSDNDDFAVVFLLVVVEAVPAALDVLDEQRRPRDLRGHLADLRRGPSQALSQRHEGDRLGDSSQHARGQGDDVGVQIALQGRGVPGRRERDPRRCRDEDAAARADLRGDVRPPLRRREEPLVLSTLRNNKDGAGGWGLDLGGGAVGARGRFSVDNGGDVAMSVLSLLLLGAAPRGVLLVLLLLLRQKHLELPSREDLVESEGRRRRRRSRRRHRRRRLCRRRGRLCRQTRQTRQTRNRVCGPHPRAPLALFSSGVLRGDHCEHVGELLGVWRVEAGPWDAADDGRVERGTRRRRRMRHLFSVFADGAVSCFFGLFLLLLWPPNDHAERLQRRGRHDRWRRWRLYRDLPPSLQAARRQQPCQDSPLAQGDADVAASRRERPPHARGEAHGRRGASSARKADDGASFSFSSSFSFSFSRASSSPSASSSSSSFLGMQSVQPPFIDNDREPAVREVPRSPRQARDVCDEPVHLGPPPQVLGHHLADHPGAEVDICYLLVACVVHLCRKLRVAAAQYEDLFRCRWWWRGRGRGRAIVVVFLLVLLLLLLQTQRQQDRLKRPPVPIPREGSFSSSFEEAVPELERAELVGGRRDEACKVAGGSRRGRGRGGGGIPVAGCSNSCSSSSRRAPFAFGAAAWSHESERPTKLIRYLEVVVRSRSSGRSAALVQIELRFFLFERVFFFLRGVAATPASKISFPSGLLLPSFFLRLRAFSRSL